MKEFLSSITLANGAVTGGQFTAIALADLPAGIVAIGGVVAGAKPNGSILYTDAAGELAQDQTGDLGNFFYDPDGTLGELATGCTLYVGDRAGGAFDGVLALRDVINAQWLTLAAGPNGLVFGAFVNASLGLGASAGVVVSGGGSGAIGLSVLADAAQTANLSQWLSSGSSVLSRVNKGGYFMTRKVAAPADADLATSELAFWLDATPGAAKLMLKAKNSSGTVVTGSVNLT